MRSNKFTRGLPPHAHRQRGTAIPGCAPVRPSSADTLVGAHERPSHSAFVGAGWLAQTFLFRSARRKPPIFAGARPSILSAVEGFILRVIEGRPARLLSSLLVAILSLALTASAQIAPPPRPPAPLPTPTPQSAVKVTTRIVQVSVTVHDDHGRPVTGLTKDDFILMDEGKRQQITAITEQSNRLVTTAATPTPNLFTNRFEKGASQAPLTVIILDAYNTRFWDMQMTLANNCPWYCNKLGGIFIQVEKFISQMHPEDRVAIYEIANKLYLLQDFTSDPASLQLGVERGKEYASEIKFSRSQMEPADMDAFTMGVMHEIADRLAKIPGRKNMIWLSTGFPPDDSLSRASMTTIDKMDAASKILGNADFPLFAIDAKGLNVEKPPIGPVPGGGRTRGASAGGGPTPASGNYGSRSLQGRIPKLRDFDYSKNLADISGGRAYENTNDFAGAMRNVIDDSASTYILSYYPDHNKWNGEFREIKVKVNRPGLSGLEVRARKGYFATTDTASAQEKDAQKLADSIRNPLESTDLGFDVQADGVELAGVRQLKVKITLDANQLHFQQQGDRRIDNVSENWVEFNAEGHQVGAHSQTLNLRPTSENYQKLLQDGFVLSETVQIANDATEIRVILRDSGNGAIGSLTIPLYRVFPPAPTTPAKP
jgi:VWFA-related protein